MKQNPDKPVFPDLLWSKPETKRRGGKLLIMGGHSHSLAAPAKAFAAAEAAGVGTARVILPDVTRKILGKSFPEAEFAPSTPSGSLAQSALGTMLDNAGWADGVLMAGDFGRNSETAVLLEKFIQKFDGQLVVAGDGIDPFLQTHSILLKRPGTLCAIEFSKLQKLSKNNFPDPPLLNSSELPKITGTLDTVTSSGNVGFLTEHGGHIVVSLSGRSSVTPLTAEDNWQVPLPAYAAVWRLHQPVRPFEAITTAVWEYINP